MLYHSNFEDLSNNTSKMATLPPVICVNYIYIYINKLNQSKVALVSVNLDNEVFISEHKILWLMKNK